MIRALKMAGSPGPLYWREAATLILAAPKNPSNVNHGTSAPRGRYDYKVLHQQRSSKHKFMPGVYVYPGGTISEADYSSQWKSIFESGTGKPLNSILEEIHVPGPRPPMLSLQRQWSLPANLAFRICAIRETFEESGVLIVTPKQAMEKEHTTQQTSAKSYSAELMNADELDKWRSAVHNDDQQFLELCRQFEVVPNIWSLYEWGNWLTPVSPGMVVDGPPKKPYRFDTIFYICPLESMSEAVQDNTETTATKWLSVDEIVDNYQTGSIPLIGPQIYENSKLANFHKFATLTEFARNRGQMGLERWCPTHVHCDDGYLSVLPGDELYPSNPDFEGTKAQMVMSGTTIDGLREKTKKYHRSERRDGKLWYLACNIDIKCGQPRPVPQLMAMPGNHL